MKDEVGEGVREDRVRVCQEAMKRFVERPKSSVGVVGEGVRSEIVGSMGSGVGRRGFCDDVLVDRMSSCESERWVSVDDGFCPFRDRIGFEVLGRAALRRCPKGGVNTSHFTAKCDDLLLAR